MLNEFRDEIVKVLKTQKEDSPLIRALSVFRYNKNIKNSYANHISSYPGSILNTALYQSLQWNDDEEPDKLLSILLQFNKIKGLTHPGQPSKTNCYNSLSARYNELWPQDKGKRPALALYMKEVGKIKSTKSSGKREKNKASSRTEKRFRRRIESTATAAAADFLVELIDASTDKDQTFKYLESLTATDPEGNDIPFFHTALFASVTDPKVKLLNKLLEHEAFRNCFTNAVKKYTKIYLDLKDLYDKRRSGLAAKLYTDGLLSGLSDKILLEKYPRLKKADERVCYNEDKFNTDFPLKFETWIQTHFKRTLKLTRRWKAPV